MTHSQQRDSQEELLRAAGALAGALEALTAVVANAKDLAEVKGSGTIRLAHVCLRQWSRCADRLMSPDA